MTDGGSYHVTPDGRVKVDLEAAAESPEVEKIRLVSKALAEERTPQSQEDSYGAD